MIRRHLVWGLCLVIVACQRGPEPGPPIEQERERAPVREARTSTGAGTGTGIGAGAGTGTGTGAAAGGPSAGGLTWIAHEPLVSRPPASPMRAAEYVVEGENGAAAAVMTVHFFGTGQGGGVEENLDRWMGQFRQPDGRANRDVAHIAHRTAGGGVQVTTIELTGEYNAGSMPGMPMRGPAGPQPGFKLLGAIAQGPGGMVFFKMTGAEATVDRAKSAFDAMIASIRPR